MPMTSLLQTRPSRLLTLACSLTLAPAVVGAAGVWQVSLLHPSGADASDAYAVTAGYIAGSNVWDRARYDYRPYMWSGPDLAGSRVGTARGIVFAASGADKAGELLLDNGAIHAAVWLGTLNQVRDLHPPDAELSQIWGIDGGRAVGFAYYPQLIDRALIWTIAGGTFVDVTPPGLEARLNSISGDTQGGVWFDAKNHQHAAMWRGTAESFVNLDPGGTYESEVTDVWGDVQVGYVIYTSTGVGRAALWRGSAGSLVDLTPPGAYGAGFLAIYGNVMAGTAGYADPSLGISGCGIWFGPTPDSFVNISHYLPSSYKNATISDLFVDEEGNITVVGRAIHTLPSGADRAEAVMWRYIVPEPSPLVALAAALAGLAGLRPRRRR